MKKIILVMLFSLGVYSAFAQDIFVRKSTMTGNVENIELVKLSDQRIGIGATSPNNSSILDLTSDTLGFLLPRMTDTQRDAISTPAEGLQIHDNVNNVPNFYNGTAWRRFSHTTAASLEEGGIVVSEVAKGSALITDSANFFWDNSGKKLGIKTSSPDAELAVIGAIVSNTYNFAVDMELGDSYQIDIPDLTALTIGLTVRFKVSTANTGGATLEITSIGDIDAILKMHDQALATGDVEGGQILVCTWDGTNWQMTSQLAQ